MTACPAKLCIAAMTVLVPLFTSAQTPSVAPQPETVDGSTAYVYKTVGEAKLRLHLFKANGADTVTPKPAIIFFFGGGWTQGSVTQFARQAKHLAQRGMHAVVADYRVFDRHGTSPFEAMADAKSAVRWVRAHSAELGVDPKRIAAAGGSAGGHIAASAAIFDTFDEVAEDRGVSSSPNALVLFNPALDPTPGYQQFGGRGREGSPFHHLRAGVPPTLILHGRLDTTEPYVNSDRFCAEMKTRGNECRLIGYEGATHGFFNGKWYGETLLEADRFLTKMGYLREPSPPTIP